RRQYSEHTALAGRARAIACDVVATVDAVKRLTEDVRRCFVQGAGLPGINQAVRVLGIRMRPLVAGDVVGGQPGTEGNKCAVPGSIGAAVAAIKDGIHGRAFAVERIAPEGVGEQVVGLLRGQDHVVGLGYAGRECGSLDPERTIGVPGRYGWQVHAVVGAPVHPIRRTRDLVDDLSGVGADVDELTHVDTVADLDFISEVVVTHHAFRETFTVDQQAAAASRRRRAVRLRLNELHRRIFNFGDAAGRSRRHCDIGYQGTGNDCQAVVFIEVDLQLRAEYGQPRVLLYEGKVLLAELVALGLPELEIGAANLQAEGFRVPADEGSRFGFEGLWRRSRRFSRKPGRNAYETRLASGGVHAYVGATGVRLQALDGPCVTGMIGRRCTDGSSEQSTKNGTHSRSQDWPLHGCPLVFLLLC